MKKEQKILRLETQLNEWTARLNKSRKNSVACHEVPCTLTTSRGASWMLSREVEKNFTYAR